MKKTLIIIAVSVSLVVVMLIFLSYRFMAQKNTDNSSTVATQSANTNQSSGKTDTIKVEDNLADALLVLNVKSESDVYTNLVDKFPELKKDKITLVKGIDENSNEVFLQNLLSEAGTSFPQNILENATIKLYAFRSSKDFGPSEAIVIVNDRKASENLKMMKEWESGMLDNLKKFILIGEKYDLIQSSGREDREFSDSVFYRYGRYINYTQDKAISLNYVVVDGHIVIANGVSVLHNILPKIFAL